MRRVNALVVRELRSMFRGPTAYAVLGLFLVVHALSFAQLMEDYSVRSFRDISNGRLGNELNLVDLVLRSLITGDAFFLTLFLPLLTMRSFADEWRQGTSDLLLSYPFREFELVLGKFLAAACVLWMMLAFAALYPLATLLLGSLEIPVLFSSYLGLSLYGLALLAVGLFYSTLTENQLIAFASTWATFFALLMAAFWAPRVEAPWDTVLAQLSPIGHVNAFGVGLLRLSDSYFFVVFIAIFLYLATGVLESKRWGRGRVRR
jgi:ABC-2 type transport system permease protein